MIGLLLTLALNLTPALPALRADHQAAVESVAHLDERIQLRQADLDGVAQKIEQLKQRGSAGPFIPSDLDAALRKSQSISAELDKLRATRSHDADRAAASRAVLYEALEKEISDQRAASQSASDLASRSTLLEGLKQLEAERSQLAPQPSSSPELRLSAQPTDDPRELHERADALRDRADRLARELTSVKGRIQELRDEQDLDRELKTLSRDQGLFDEGDQRVRTARVDALAVPAAAQATPRSASGLGATTAVTGLPPPTSPTTQTTGHNGAGQTIGGNGVTGNPLGTTPSSVALPSGAHVDGTPSASPTPSQVSEPRVGELVQVDGLSTASLPDDASLESLMARSQALEQERANLEAQARQLDALVAP